MSGRAARSWALVARAVVAVPDRVLLVVFWTTLVVAVTTTADAFRPVVVLPAIVVLVASTWRLAPVPHPAHARDVVATLTAVGGVAAWVVLNLPYVAQALVPLRDPGFLTLAGIWLTDHASASVEPGAALAVADRIATVHAQGGSLTLDGGLLHAQGSPVLPGLLAMLGWANAIEGVLAANLVLGGTALLGVFALARRLAGSVWALAPTAGLALGLPMLAFSRGTYTEPVVAALVLGGLVLTWSGLTARRVGHLALGGAMVASAGLVRIDGAAVLIGLAAGLSLAAGAATLPRARRHLRLSLLAVVASAGVVLLLGLAGLDRHSPHYLVSLSASLGPLLLALAATVLVGVALAHLPLGPLRRALVRRRRGVAVTVGALAATVAVVLVSRPLWLVEHHTDPETGYASVVAVLQAAAGLAEERTRSYDEQTVSWLAWYQGWPAVALGLGGLALMTGAAVRRRDPRLLVVAAVVAAPTLLYLVRVSITPDQVWAMRRFLPVTLPGLLVVGTWVLAEAWRAVARHRSAARVPVRAGAAVAALAVAAAPLTTWGPVVRSVEHSGRLEQARTVCRELASVGAQRVVLVNSGVPYLPTLRLVCDVEVVEVRAAPSAGLLRRANLLWQGDGPLALVAYDDRLVPWTGDVEPGAVAPLSSITTEIWEQTLVRVPHATTAWDQAVWLGLVLPDGTVEPTVP